MRSLATLAAHALLLAALFVSCDSSTPDLVTSRPVVGTRGEYAYADWGPGDVFAVRYVPRDSARVGESGLYLLSDDQLRLVTLDSEIGPPVTFPQWSRDGAWLAFVAGGELYKVRPNGSSLTQLTSGGESKLEFAWSPAGDYLVYKVIYGWGDNRGLWIVATDGSGARQLRRPAPNEMCYNCPVASEGNPYGPGYRWFVHSPDWSSSGSEIVYVGLEHNVGHVRLLAYDTTSAHTRLLLREPSGLYEPKWSPDGTAVAVTTGNGGGGLGIVTATGGNPRWLATHAEHPNWSPDGQDLVYRKNDPFSHARGNGDLWIVNIRSGVSRQLTTSTGVAR